QKLLADNEQQLTRIRQDLAALRARADSALKRAQAVPKQIDQAIAEAQAREQELERAKRQNWNRTLSDMWIQASLEHESRQNLKKEIRTQLDDGAACMAAGDAAQRDNPNKARRCYEQAAASAEDLLRLLRKMRPLP